MKLPSFKITRAFRDNHEKPWGGVYAKRLWKWMLVTTLALLIISALEQYRLYVYYTRPVIVSEQALSQEIVNLDMKGLDKAVADIRDKEAKFNQYVKQKVQITDPAN